MQSRPYSFIDIAVLDEVRKLFAEGAALAILDSTLEQIIWANGGGAELLGFPDVESALDAPAEIGPVAMRQIRALPSFPDLRRPAPLSVRLSRGVNSQVVAMTVASVTLPAGESAFLVSVPVAEAVARDEAAVAAQILKGLVGEGQAAAVVDGEARLLAASAGFAALGLSQATLHQLVADVGAEQDRLVKRKIDGARGAYPAAIAHLADEPARHLLIVIDDPDPIETAPERAEAEAPTAASHPATVIDHAPVETRNISEPGISEATDAPASVPADAAQSAHRDKAADADEEPAPGTGEADSEPDLPQKIDLSSAPIRFVWRTDANGRFSSVSEEFVQAVGAASADIIGRTFREVSTVFGMDHAGEIAGLLERRDTWSGRMIHWPLAGTELQVPVDLAALPVYGRERNFEGFRGFGVVRLAEARPDPERIGLSLVPGARLDELTRAAEPEAMADPSDAPEDGSPAATLDDPFRGEVPALELDSRPTVETDATVVRLAERRSSGPDRQLSSIERQAFREIGERLRREQKIDPPVADSPGDEAYPADPTGSDIPTHGAGDIGDPEATATVDLTGEAPGWPAFEPEGKAPETHYRVESHVAEQHEGTAARPDTSILDQLPVPILLHSGDELHYANPEFLRLTGYDSLEELRAAGGLGELFVEPFDDAETDGQHELRMRNRTGEEFPAEALLRIAPWNGRRALMLAVRQTGEAAAGMPSSEELRQRLAEMRTIIDTATDGVILVDRDGQIRSISHPAEALFGFDGDDVKGRPLISLFAVESQPTVRDYLQTLSLGGVASVMNDGREVIGREAEGRFIPMFMTIGRLPADRGFCAVVRDITQWKRAEEELTKARADAERASAQKSDFLARVSHEIRTPLNAIIGFSELMVDEKFGPISNDRYRDYLRDINRSGNHVLDLVNDLLDLSKIEAGQQDMHYEAVSLNEALAEAVAMMQPQANRERVIIRSSFAPRLPDVVADLRSIRQIALNILSNAVRYTQAGGQVVISTAQEKNGDIAMRVRDTGVGMSQAELEQAMKPFQQVNALKRARGDGTGLGLPLTKAMVEANRARFSISSNPGEGTLVEVSFPAARVLAE